MRKTPYNIEIKYSLTQKIGLFLIVISPISLLIMFAGAGILPSNIVFVGHWAALLGIFTITPFGLIVFFIGTWFYTEK